MGSRRSILCQHPPPSMNWCQLVNFGVNAKVYEFTARVLHWYVGLIPFWKSSEDTPIINVLYGPLPWFTRLAKAFFSFNGTKTNVFWHKMLLRSPGTTSKPFQTFYGSKIRRPPAAMSQNACSSTKIFSMDCNPVAFSTAKHPLIFIFAFLTDFYAFRRKYTPKELDTPILWATAMKSRWHCPLSTRGFLYDSIVALLFFPERCLVAHGKVRLE